MKTWADNFSLIDPPSIFVFNFKPWVWTFVTAIILSKIVVSVSGYLAIPNWLNYFSVCLDETATIRVTNLSEDTRESDLQELFRPFGPISRIYLAKDKNTGQSKVFIFSSFNFKFDCIQIF